MRSYAQILGELYAKYGGNKSSIARKLGNGISSQRLGQYESGRSEPKADFIELWKKVFGDDLLAMREGIEKNVSHGTLDSIPMELWNELKDNNSVFKQELERLWGERQKFWDERDKFWALINRLTGPEPRKAQKG